LNKKVIFCWLCFPR